MAIRFQCSACTQPIEIDDEWASRAVACPYCRKTISAPAESTLDPPDQIPTATPLGPINPPPAECPPPGISVTTVVPHDRNILAVVALVLAIAAIALMITSSAILASHPLELQDLTEAAAKATSIQEKMQVQSAYFAEHPSAATWIIPAGMLFLAGGLCNLAAVICGIIAVRRVARRTMAAVALVLAGTVTMLSCCGSFFA